MLLGREQGPAGPIISEASYAAMTPPVASRAFAQRETSYGSGMSLFRNDDRQLLGQGGGMVG
jgi:hypothetical protein